MNVYHKKISFRGHVQGVGFRYQAYNVAKGFDVAGYIRNEIDGSVTIEIEGEQEELDAFQAEVIQELEPFIRKIEESSDYREARFMGFTIAR